MTGSKAPVVWWVTTGQAGFRTQARGLARAVSPDAIEKVIGLKAPWSLAPPWLSPLVLANLDPRHDRLAPPWPDLIISCSRKAAKVAIAVRRASGGRTLAVHIQNPLAPLSEFDLVIPMRHDAVDGPNVLQADTALHDVTPALLAAAAQAWRGRFAALPRPLTGVFLGGSNKQITFMQAQGEAIVQGLKTLRAAIGGGLAITPSRRTPPEVKAVFAAAFADDPTVFLWDETGENPYRGILALADRLVVTGDSVSMVSEAAATARGVAVFDVGGGRRHRRFIANLVERGLVSAFDGTDFGPGAGAPVDATPAAAQAVRQLLYARTGVSG